MVVKNLRESREMLDIKQKEIAELFNVHFSTISGWETGKDTIPLERLIEYANHFNYSLDYLFGFMRNNNPNLTQKDVAKSLNTNQAAYAHYENAIYLIPTTFLFNLTKIYKPFSIDELLGRRKKQ